MTPEELDQIERELEKALTQFQNFTSWLSIEEYLDKTKLCDFMVLAGYLFDYGFTAERLIRFVKFAELLNSLSKNFLINRGITLIREFPKEF